MSTPSAPITSRAVLADPAAPTFTRGLWRIAGAQVTCGNAVTLLDSDATIEAMLADIAAAQQRVVLEMYIFRGDALGRRMTDALVAAAQRGVQVQVLADWFGSRGSGTGAQFARLRTAGADVRQFSPPGFRPWLGALPRDHRKVLVCDAHVGMTGGVNLGDEWTSRFGRRRAAWRDTAIRFVGPAALDLQRAFEGMWGRTVGTGPSRAERRRQRRLVRPARNAELGPDAAPALVGIIEGEPGRFRISRALQYQSVAAERSIWIASAYFVPGGAELEALAGAARDGVDVRLLVPSSYDHPWIRRMTRRRYRRLLENGVRIWEWRGEMMHAKSSVTDGHVVCVGSTDFNPLGLAINYELDAIVLDTAVGAAAEAIFLADLASSTEITLRSRETRDA